MVNVRYIFALKEFRVLGGFTKFFRCWKEKCIALISTNVITFVETPVTKINYSLECNRRSLVNIMEQKSRIMRTINFNQSVLKTANQGHNRVNYVVGKHSRDNYQLHVINTTSD